MGQAPHIRLREAAAFERPVRFRFPFRFGAARVEAASQAFVRLRVGDARGRDAIGWSAEMMMPKWFDKSPDLTAEDNADQLRRSTHRALALMREAGAAPAFALHARVEAAHHAACARDGLNGLIASFGLALVDRAMLDALGRLHGLAAAEALRSNLPGLDAATAPDLAGFDLDAFLARLAPRPLIAARHTIGLGDALTEAEVGAPADGLPRSLTAAIAAYGHRFFKIKVSGDVDIDLDRLERIAAVLDASVPDYKATLDGNEQFADADAVAALLDRIEAAPALARLRARLLFLEQPIARARTFDTAMHPVAARLPLEIDEADGTIDAFPRARPLGYAGVSSKSCKGFYRALLNAARVARWNAEGARCFLSAEDLTVQPGVALQQDLVLAALTGNAHGERNGHHFVDGMGGAPAAEQAAFAAAHPDLYAGARGRTRLRIDRGEISFGSVLAAPGLGGATAPDPSDLVPMPVPGDWP